MGVKPRWVHAVSADGECEWGLIAHETRGRIPLAVIAVITTNGFETLPAFPHALSKELALRAFTWHEEEECPRSGEG